MALGDGIRRNVATITQAERDRLIAAFLALDTAWFYGDGVSYWDKQEDIHKAAHAGGTDVHHGPAFIPWHRELVNRLEALLRGVDPELSLHYWDWTTDPRPLLTPNFMGGTGEPAGPPFENFESTEDEHPFIWRQVAAGAPPVDKDKDLIQASDGRPKAEQFAAFRTAIEHSHDIAHGYIGGSIGDPHFSFHDPFVFLLHSNMDRLFAMWQTQPNESWRLDPDQVYGAEAATPSLLGNVEPWAGGQGLRPWAPPERQQVVKTYKDPSIVTPPRYDTLPSLPYPGFEASVTAVARKPGQFDLWAVGKDGNVWSAYWSEASGWGGWFSLDAPPDRFPSGASVAAVARNSGQLDLWAVGKDGNVWSAYWSEASGWGGWFSLGAPGGGVLPGTHVTAVARKAGQIDIWAVGKDGKVCSAYWSESSGWGSWFSLGAPPATFPPGAPVAAIARGSEQLDLWAVAKDGQIWSVAWSEASGWGVWFSLGAPGGEVPPGTEVTALARKPGQLDIWAVGNDGKVSSAAWSESSGWSGWFSLGGPAGGLPKGTPIAAVARKPEQLDVWAVGKDGHLWSTYWSDSSGWGGWFSLGAPPTGLAARPPIAAIARMRTQLDLWGIAKDGHVWSTYWSETSGWGGWFRL